MDTPDQTAVVTADATWLSGSNAYRSMLSRVLNNSIGVAVASNAVVFSDPVNENQTTAVVQRYLDELPACAAIRRPSRSSGPCWTGPSAGCTCCCGTLLYRSYPRLTRPPLNLQADEMLGAVVERLLKALREVRPRTVRQFFALANQHMRWELNDLARRLDEQARRGGAARVAGAGAAGPSSGSRLSPERAAACSQAIDGLPEDEREAFDLVRIQGLTQPEAAEVLGVSAKTVQRRLNRGRLLLAEQLADLRPDGTRAVRPARRVESIGCGDRTRRACAMTTTRGSWNCSRRSSTPDARRRRSARTAPSCCRRSGSG